VKEHPAHPRTGRLILARAHEGIRRSGVDEAILGYVANTDPADFKPAQELVKHETIKAVGFTGSRRGGLALEDLARSRPDRIPVFAEMGSANPVIVTPTALQVRGESIAQQIADSVLARFGQQCTCPGIIVVPDASGAGKTFTEALAARLDAAPEREMLAPWIRDAYVKRMVETAAVPDVRVVAGRADAMSFSARGARAGALLTTADRFAWHAELREEIFGPGILIVNTPPDLIGTLPLPSTLTLSLFFDDRSDEDLALTQQLLETYSPLAGRIIFNGVPTGVRVAEAMVHGGPFPATNRPETTAVGPRAIERWCRPVCWQNAPPELLPVDLQDDRPTSK
jgi:NADP-dependent aldehyde dehydrogenase